MLPSNLHPVLVFDPYMNDMYNQWNENLTKLLKQSVEYPRRIDWAPLNEVGFTRKITKELTQYMTVKDEIIEIHDWERLFEIQEPIYLELCQEFLATLEMYEIETIDERFITFHLGAKAHQLTTRQLARALQIYTNEELEAPWFERYLCIGETLDECDVGPDDWAKFSNKSYKGGSNPSSAIKSVEYKIIQKFLAHTITGRGKNKEKVTRADLWYLSRLNNNKQVNLPYCVARYLLDYASGPKAESKICGGQYITRIAKYLKVNLRPRANPYTLVPDPGLVIGVEMFRAAGAVKVKKGKFVPFKTNEPGVSSRIPRMGGRGKRHASQSAEDSDEDSDEEEREDDRTDDEDVVMRDAGGQGSSRQRESQQQEPSYWQRFLSSFQSMKVNQQQGFDQFRDEARYELGSLHYKEDYLIHNQQRLFQNPPPEYPTPFHQPPRWGEPGGFLPAPVYDREAAMRELQRQEEYMRTAEYQQQQSQWGSDWQYAPPYQSQGSSRPGESTGNWLFQSYQQPPHDPSQD